MFLKILENQLTFEASEEFVFAKNYACQKIRKLHED